MSASVDSEEALDAIAGDVHAQVLLDRLAGRGFENLVDLEFEFP